MLEFIPPAKKLQPDFNQLLAVLHREAPLRPTLFEFFLNDRLYDLLADPSPPGLDDSLIPTWKVITAFKNAGYDYATFLLPGFDFPSNRQKVAQTISINAGGVIKDWTSFRAYPWPDPQAANVEMLDRLSDWLPAGMKLVGYSPDGVLENVIKLVGYQDLCYLLSDDERLVQSIFDGVGERLVDYYEILSGHPVIGACISNDDWGFKTHTLLSPASLRRFVFPWHRRIVEKVHAAGKPVILHSCGYFERIIDDIVDEMEFDGRHSYEDAILPVEQAYERYHSRIAILGGIDVDFICRMRPEAVYQRARALLEQTRQCGGYALGTGNSVPEYVPDQGFFALLQAALEARL